MSDSTREWVSKSVCLSPEGESIVGVVFVPRIVTANAVETHNVVVRCLFAGCVGYIPVLSIVETEGDGVALLHMVFHPSHERIDLMESERGEWHREIGHGEGGLIGFIRTVDS